MSQESLKVLSFARKAETCRTVVKWLASGCLSELIRRLEHGLIDSFTGGGCVFHGVVRIMFDLC